MLCLNVFILRTQLVYLADLTVLRTNQALRVVQFSSNECGAELGGYACRGGGASSFRGPSEGRRKEVGKLLGIF